MNSPTIGSSRIETLDLIRGIAVCGLFPINSIEFGFNSLLILYPFDLPESELPLWTLVMGLGAGKFATLFAALFGAGTILFCERAEASGRSAASLYLPRVAWLFVFGLIHSYLIWHGDILVSYAVTGFVFFWCRKWSAKVFWIVGSALMVGFVAPMVLLAVVSHFIDFGESVSDWPKVLETIRKEGAKETESFTGDWVDQMKLRALYAVCTHFLAIPFYLFWLVAMIMCFGGALMKSGFFEDRWSRPRLNATTGISLAVGLLLTVGGYAVFAYAAPSAVVLCWAYTALFLGMPLVAFGYAGLGVIWSRNGAPGFLRRGFAAVGRMALTNYIAQSVILGLIYYGHGLALRGKLDFYEAMLIAPVVWILQMIVSRFWLNHFTYGPLEWLWRCLTYVCVVPIRRKSLPPEIS